MRFSELGMDPKAIQAAFQDIVPVPVPAPDIKTEAHLRIKALQDQGLSTVEAAQTFMERSKAIEEKKLNRQINLENKKLTKELRLQAKPLEDDFGKVEEAFSNILKAAKRRGGLAQVAILYGFIKSIDRNSVVKEGEVRLSEAGVPILGKLANALNKFTTGERLPQESVKQVVELAGDAYETVKKIYNKRMQGIKDTGVAYELPDKFLKIISKFKPEFNAQEEIDKIYRKKTKTRQDYKKMSRKDLIDAYRARKGK